MSLPDQLSQLETELRAAVAGGDFARAREVWERYAASLRDSVATDPSAAARLDDARHLIDWTQRTCAAVRAQATEQLNNLTSSTRYRQNAASRRHTFRITG